MKNKNELLKISLYILGTAMVFEIYLSLTISIVYGESLSQNMNYLIGVPLICGPSLGYSVYRIIKNYKRIQTDLDFRAYILFRTTVEGCAIAFPIWGVMRLIGIL